MKPSPFMASVDPTRKFDPDIHIACDEEFVCKTMSPLADELKAITEGVGMPDRATEAWVSISDPDVLALLNQLSIIGSPSLQAGQGKAGWLQPDDHQPVAFQAYVEDNQVWLSFARTERSRVLSFLRNRLKNHEVTIEDHTNRVARIALMGPDAGKLFTALEFEESNQMTVGDHQIIDIIQEPVRVCRSDFAGPLGYDLVIDREPFNMILAVLCAWAVRLELQLLPVGFEAVDRVRQKQQRGESAQKL